jgi:phytoene dehydrogenase-like protein
MTDQTRDAVVVGAGPNGLAAAIVLAKAGRSVTVFESSDSVGGGCRTKPLTLPGFQHDVCSAVHPLAVSSPFFRSLPLQEYGLEWVQPEVALAHPFDDGTAILLHRSVDATAAALGRDADAYRKLFTPLVKGWTQLTPQVLAPVTRLPRHPLLLARFGLQAMRSARGLAKSAFREEKTRAVFTGLAAHANLPLGARLTASFGLVLGAAAHAAGWPIARGGSQAIADALAAYLRSLGGEVITSAKVESLDGLGAGAYLLDLTPRQAARIATGRISPGRQRRLGRFRYGSGVFKIDFALDGPIPWRAPECARSATLHLGGTLAEIAESERAVAEGRHPERPYVLLSQPSVFDPTRAPPGKQAVWAYCHVPSGSGVDMTAAIEAQIERFAPGFRDRILARHTLKTAELEQYNANYIGGDIAAGALDGGQLLLRPGLTVNPYDQGGGVYLCSASTPPGPGVHGMCGYFAAEAALRRMR